MLLLPRRFQIFQIQLKQVGKYSAGEAMALIIDTRLPKFSYQLIRSGTLEKEHNFYPTYNDVRDAKLKCYPANITVEDYSALDYFKNLMIFTCKESVQFKNLC